MIAGTFHQGSGLGNQLFRYIFTRVKALDMGVDFGMVNVKNFKGSDFLDLDMGKPVQGLTQEFVEQRINNAEGVDIRPFDPRTREIRDNTLVEGEFQDEKYFGHRLDEIREWLTPTLPAPQMDKNECILAHRGGEYTLFPDLYLTKKYWYDAMENMRRVNPKVHFRYVTDDVFSAMEMFPGIPGGHEIADDWMSIRYAPYLILSNSSFGIFPALLNDKAKKIIAPLHWARHNIGVWALPQNCYRKFAYQDRNGELYEH